MLLFPCDTHKKISVGDTKLEILGMVNPAKKVSNS